jgi:hypothetical protein
MRIRGMEEAAYDAPDVTLLHRRENVALVLR